jgi:Zn-dependent protease
MLPTIQSIVISLPPILVALTFHEFAHGYVALRFGDPTAKFMGRLTLNPLAHLDPLGTIMLILVRFGWAKPVPVNPRNLKNPRQDMLWIALAGPAMNLLLASITGLIIRIIIATQYAPTVGSLGAIFLQMLLISLYINLALAVFNLLPFPPLDGSKILAGMLPRKYDAFLMQLEHYGPNILFGIIILGYFTNVRIIGLLIGPFVKYFSHILAGI